MHPTNTRSWLFSRQQAADWSSFVNYWDGIYNYSSKSDAYQTFVIERGSSFIFNDKNVRKLFEWKNNTDDKLSVKKAKSVEAISGNLPTLNELAENWDNSIFNTAFGKISTVWQTFLMHIIQPDKFPIFDQHVYRAYTYLQTGQAEELKGTIKHQLSLYANYNSFFEAIRNESGCNPRQLDRALWAFGKFIKQYPSLLFRTT